MGERPLGRGGKRKGELRGRFFLPNSVATLRDSYGKGKGAGSIEVCGRVSDLGRSVFPAQGRQKTRLRRSKFAFRLRDVSPARKGERCGPECFACANHTKRVSGGQNFRFHCAGPPARVSGKSAPQDCQVRVSHKSVKKECHTRV